VLVFIASCFVSIPFRAPFQLISLLACPVAHTLLLDSVLCFVFVPIRTPFQSVLMFIVSCFMSVLLRAPFQFTLVLSVCHLLRSRLHPCSCSSPLSVFVSCPYSHSFIATCPSLASCSFPFVTVSYCASHCSSSR